MTPGGLNHTETSKKDGENRPFYLPDGGGGIDLDDAQVHVYIGNVTGAEKFVLARVTSAVTQPFSPGFSRSIGYLLLSSMSFCRASTPSGRSFRLRENAATKAGRLPSKADSTYSRLCFS